jgi:RNA polymerase sigma-70 factor, ECF subfamily
MKAMGVPTSLFGRSLLVARVDEVDARRLLDRVARGDREAFEVFYDSYGARVMAMVRRQVGVRQMAEELVQDVFVAVWLGARGYRADMGDPGQWLLGIARHKLQDHWRRLRGLMRMMEAQAEQGLLERRMVDADVRLLIEEALTHLPADQRRALDLIYTGGLTFAETARALGVPAGTVKSRVHAALLTLRSFFRRSATS